MDARHVVLGEHPRGLQRPLVAVGPHGVRAAGIDHDLAVRAGLLARRGDDRLVHRGVDAAEGAPSNLEGAEAAVFGVSHALLHLVWLGHQQRAVGAHALAVAPAQQPRDGLLRQLAENVPQRDIDPRDGVRDAAAPPLPEPAQQTQV